jgi:hypothetical protein
MSGIQMQPYDPRIDHLLEPSFLSQVLPWFDDFLLYIQREREKIRQADIGGKYNTKAAGFSPSGKVHAVYEMPTMIKNYVDGIDKSILKDQKKRDAFLKNHPEYDLRVSR